MARSSIYARARIVKTRPARTGACVASGRDDTMGAVSPRHRFRSPEVPAMSVPRSTRAAVSEALAAVARDLGLPRVHVRWFKGARVYHDAADAALSALASRIRPGLQGAAVPAVGPP